MRISDWSSDVCSSDLVVERGPHHASPPCRHYGRCGGCQLQHVDDAAYRAFISDRIRHALAQQGISAPDMEEPHLSPAGCRRRASLRVQKRQGRVVLGFNEGERHRLVDIAECPVLRSEEHTSELQSLMRITYV